MYYTYDIFSNARIYFIWRHGVWLETQAGDFNGWVPLSIEFRIECIGRLVDNIRNNYIVNNII